MGMPTQQQLNDPAWWDENVPPGCIRIAVHYIGGKVWSFEPLAAGVTATSAPCNAEVRFVERPTKPVEPDRTSPEWSDWKIPPGSWPHWMLERMHRETGRMSYDNPVKGMIRDLWATVDKKPAAPEWDGEGARPTVNTAFEFSANGEFWEERVMLFDDGITCLMAHRKYPANRWHYKCNDPGWDCRPIRTQAERDREALAVLLEPYCRGSYCGNERAVADAIIAAGWRNGEVE